MIEIVLGYVIAGMLYLQEAAMSAPEPEPEVVVEVVEEYYEEPYYEEYYDYSYDYYYYEEPYYDYSYDYSYSYSSSDNPDLYSAGVIYDGGTRYTWYSQNVLPGNGLTELNSNGRTVDENGYVVDGDGYIAVATSGYSKGEVIDTPFGKAKVYDYCETPGTIDVYTAW